MTINQNRTIASAGDPAKLAQALKRSEHVRAKVEACADELGTTNEVVKKGIAAGATTLSAPEALAESEKIETKVQECAEDLHEVNESLAHGIADLQQTEKALIKSREALAATEVALAAAKEEEKRATLRAMHDATTGLPNRGLYDDRLAHAISIAERHDWAPAVMFLDLDRFKSINDTYGHAAGDVVLKEVAKRLLKHARDEDTVCRNGGDEFLYLLMDPQGRENIERIAHGILRNIAQPIDLGNVQLIIETSIGIAVYPDNGVTGDELIKNADAAMYCAKKRMSGLEFFNAFAAVASESEGEGNAGVHGPGSSKRSHAQ
jgi:diguanylate cyclase (GGDEF)-like protein